MPAIDATIELQPSDASGCYCCDVKHDVQKITFWRNNHGTSVVLCAAHQRQLVALIRSQPGGDRSPSTIDAPPAPSDLSAQADAYASQVATSSRVHADLFLGTREFHTVTDIVRAAFKDGFHAARLTGAQGSQPEKEPGPDISFYEDRARWYLDGCPNLEDRDGYYASGDLARDAGGDLLALCSRARDLKAALASSIGAQAKSPREWQLEGEIKALQARLDVARDAYEQAKSGAQASLDRPCPTFSDSADDPDCCKHCGWTEEAHIDVGAQASPQPTWQPIETAPQDHSWFLAWSDDLGFFVYRTGPGLIAAEEPDPTHWMPLPDPPASPQPTEKP